MEHDTIGVIDFGGQYAHLIATKVRHLRVRAEIRQPEDPLEMYAGYGGVIISGSPSLSAFGEGADYNREVFSLSVPILGFCFGHQEIAKNYGGRVEHHADLKEWGASDLTTTRPHVLFEGLGAVERVWMSHNDTVVALGPDFEEIGCSRLGAGGVAHRNAAIASDRLRRYGFQFHPEVDDTIHGETMIGNFVRKICGCRPSWTMESYLEQQMDALRRHAAGRPVFLLASGGVDSTVAAVLLGRALGPERLRLLHIDTGLMRKDESREVLAEFARAGLDQNLSFVDASQDFLDTLAGVVDPEEKRRRIGEMFIRVFDREVKKLDLRDTMLGQGTIYPDTIESGGTRRADKIKTHHNRVGVIEDMIREGRVVEPLVELYKAEVREVGALLGIDQTLLARHPFPGPGLSIRVLCSNGEESVAVDGDRILAFARAGGLDALPLPIRSVGVKADLRVYEHPVLLSGEAAWDALLEAAGMILNHVHGINRVIWNLGPAPRCLSPVAATVTRERLELLRDADAVMMNGLRRFGLYDKVWQCPTVLVPLSSEGRGRDLVVLRPVASIRGMTAAPVPLPRDLIEHLRARILPMPGVSGLALDITSKPPGTIEWE